MPTRYQTLRSSLKGVRPAAGSREVGELYVNFADRQIGMVNASKAPIDLVGVRYFSTGADYATGDYVVQAGQLYRAKNSVTAGAFSAADWDALSMVPADLLAAIKSVDGTTSGLDADLLDGLDSTAFATPAFVAANYAPLASPVFTGDPRITTTPPNTDSDTSIASTQFVKSVRLDMFASPFASVGMNGQQITSLGAPSNPTDAATKAYVDAKPAGAVISDTPPGSPSQGQTWWESDSGAFFIWYNDGNTSQWVQVNSVPPPAPAPGIFKLGSGVTAAQATLDVAIPAGYMKYELAVMGILPVTNATPLVAQLSADGTNFSVTASYNWGSNATIAAASSTNAANGASGASGITLLGLVGSSTNTNIVIEIPGGPGAAQILWRSFHWNGTTYYSATGGGIHTGMPSPPKAIRLLFGAGNITAGCAWQLNGVK